MRLAKMASLPVRGAWIEIGTGTGSQISRGSRSPCGERGLKLLYARDAGHGKASLPVRGAWIEINQDGHTPGKDRVAPRAGSVD